jgi:excinuclease ABC subunit C
MTEVGRVQAFFDSGGESLVKELESERDRLSAALDFEAAAQLHAKIAKVKAIVVSADEICRRLDQLDAVIVQPSTEKDSVTLFRFRRGELAGPKPFAVEVAGESESLEHRLRSHFAQPASAGSRTAVQFTEELALLKRWYYRTHKLGEIILARTDGELPIRKLANAVTRVSTGEKQPAANGPASQESSPLPTT